MIYAVKLNIWSFSYTERKFLLELKLHITTCIGLLNINESAIRWCLRMRARLSVSNIGIFRSKRMATKVMTAWYTFNDGWSLNYSNHIKWQDEAGMCYWNVSYQYRIGFGSNFDGSSDTSDIVLYIHHSQWYLKDITVKLKVQHFIKWYLKHTVLWRN